MENQEVQGVQGTPREAETNEPANKPEESPAVKPPTYEELKADNERKDHQIRTLQGVVRAKERTGITRADFDNLVQLVNDNQVLTAQMLDELATKPVAGDYAEPGQPATASRKSFTERIEEKRKADKEKPQPVDPVAQAFVTLMSSNGMNWESPEVKEALGETEGIPKSPQEAFDHLRQTIEGKRRGDIEKEADLIVEKKLKSLGFTGTGAIAPKSPGQADTSKMSARDLILAGLQDREKSK